MTKKELFKHMYLTGDFTILENYPEHTMNKLLQEYEVYEKNLRKVLTEKESYNDVIKYKIRKECKCKSLHKPNERIRCHKELLEHIVFKLKKIKPGQKNKRERQLITEAISYYDHSIAKYNSILRG